MELKSDVKQDVLNAVSVLRRGGVILYPTDTVWGLGCDATNDAAVRRLYEIKCRADHKAMIVLVEGVAMLERTVVGIPDVAYDLVEVSERPLTIVYDRGVGVSPLLLGPGGTLGVRVTHEDVSRAICHGLGRPLVSTSANISGEPPASCFTEIPGDILSAVDYVCVSRRDEVGTALPSMVMRLCSDSSFTILRK